MHLLRERVNPMKKQSLLKLFLTTALLCSLCLTGCGDKAGDTESSDSGSQDANQDAQVDNAEDGEETPVGNSTIEFTELTEDSYQERAIVRSRNLERIQNVMERAAKGEELTIGYIGGSITMGSGASSYKKCYASLVSDWWEKSFPDASFTFVNAGIGATDSKFACARCYDDLLQYNPDFVIVEFSVNDESHMAYSESYESLLRMILDYETNPALLILNMVTYNGGYNAQDIHNAVAFRYDLPAVSMKTSIYADIESGVLKATDVSADMTHPNDLGHEYTASIVTYFMEKVYAKGFEENFYEPYKLPDPTKTLVSINAKRHRNDTLQAELNGFTKDESKQNGITDVFKMGYEAKNEGDSMTFTVEGSRISLQYRRTNANNAPHGVAIIDGDEATAVELDGNFPGGWGDWLYYQTIYEGDAGEHTVEIRLTDSADKAFYLVSVITAQE